MYHTASWNYLNIIVLHAFLTFLDCDLCADVNLTKFG